MNAFCYRSVYWIGYSRGYSTDSIVTNVDMSTKDVRTTLTVGAVYSGDEVENYDPTGKCVGISVHFDPFYGTSPAIVAETRICSDTHNYICKFQYSQNAIIFVSKESVDWYQAEEQCQMKGGHLASIHDATEQATFDCLLDDK